MSKLIALRLPDEVLASVDAMARAEGMNRSQAIIALLRESDSTVGSGVVAVASKPAVVAESTVVAPVVATPKKVPEPKAAQPAARLSGCAKCGALGGSHQKWCGK